MKYQASKKRKEINEYLLHTMSLNKEALLTFYPDIKEAGDETRFKCFFDQISTEA